MSDHERIYAMLVDANLVADPDDLPETLNDARRQLRLLDPESAADDVDVVELLPSRGSRGTRHVARRVAIAAGLLLLVGAGVVLAQGSDTVPVEPVAPAGPATPIEQATAFIDRLDAGDVGGAAELLSDPLGTVWFISIGEARSTEEIHDYLAFSVAAGAHTELDACTSVVVGPRTVVTCEAHHQADALLPLGLVFPAFDMTFDVWGDGIRTIGWTQRDPDDFDTAFGESRFFEFRREVLEPRGMLQSSGDPVWSKENGELIAGLVEEFLAEGG
jgi:hypothetical protein